MGMSIRIEFSESPPPSWPMIRQGLLAKGVSPQMRMIDGELSYPDEEPSESWQELRIALSGGMISLRKANNSLECVVWGNADANLRESWRLLAEVCAEVGRGQIVSG